jgi:hypothetical protein
LNSGVSGFQNRSWPSASICFRSGSDNENLSRTRALQVVELFGFAASDPPHLDDSSKMSNGFQIVLPLFGYHRAVSAACPEPPADSGTISGSAIGTHSARRRRDWTMLDSNAGATMAPSDQNLTRRVDGLEIKLDDVSEKIDRLSDSIDQRFEQVDRRFEQIDAAFVEQRQYTEFAYQRLDTKMDAGFGRLEGHMGRVERKVDQLIDIIKP